jgi:hypothetical protein
VLGAVVAAAPGLQTLAVGAARLTDKGRWRFVGDGLLVRHASICRVKRGKVHSTRATVTFFARAAFILYS